MKRVKFNLRKMATAFACLAVIVMSGCEEDPIDTGTEQDADIVAFTFEGIDGHSAFDKTAHTVAAKAAETVDLTAIVAEFTLSTGATAAVGGVAQVSKQTANNFTAPVTYKVTSGDGETVNNWTVTVTGRENRRRRRLPNGTHTGYGAGWRLVSQMHLYRKGRFTDKQRQNADLCARHGDPI
jgi:hypothetical protein